ncbi:3-oxoacyl-[acyl-carrier-protein] synthase III C-terminal domain-containing protein [Saccharothrix texasensis]|uniref:3-oxoacyl-[acyl-carrier-protein] synthase-3 n=1 Tax=Saccharothrix texasensis TaxID=103734 RepID=A0A3N1H254_9PSEU|nr:3-oxoacyl-[acyl-carrier-protein] synthase III C-terminal domain-containing protein [Saccharothrix texasensis]ROP36615.1 3-oxoacyl-[acyl-carrier-protein] synthase-3 [Saccharothrix texasensis]
MASQLVDFGVAGFGYATGEDQDVAQTAGDYVGDPERVVRWGYHTFHRAPDGVTATDLAALAGQDALDRLGLAPNDVDLVVVAASEVPDYHHWDTSAAVARRLKVEGTTQTMLLTEGCACGVTGLGYVAGQLALQPELRTVLFIAVNRVSEFHRNRMNVNNAVHSDGAVAAVLKRGHEGVKWLATDQFVDPDLSDFFRTEVGGAANPLPFDGWTAKDAPPGHARIQAHFDKDPAKLREFVATLNQRITDTIDNALRRADLTRDDLKHVIYINDSTDTIEEVAEPFGVTVEHTNAELSLSHGHMGAADQLFCLGEHIERGDVKSGDVVALCGISIGMRWYCTLVRI